MARSNFLTRFLLNTVLLSGSMYMVSAATCISDSLQSVPKRLYIEKYDPEMERLMKINQALDSLVVHDSTFMRKVDVTTGHLALNELLRNIARTSGVNLSVRGVEKIPVSCNFTQTSIDNLLRFLCREYQLDIAIIGNIVSIFPAAKAPILRPEPDISYNASDTTLYYDLHEDRLIDVAKKIGQLSASNIIIPEQLYEYKISGYVQNMSYNDALKTLAAINGLCAEQKSSKTWVFFSEPSSKSNDISYSYVRHRQFSPDELAIDSLGRITAHINRGNVQDLILDLCEALQLNYFFQTPITYTAGIWVDNADFETILSVLLKGSSYSYYCERGIWIFGAVSENEISSAIVVPMKYRAVSQIEEIIPSVLQHNINIKTFPDLNALILSGDQRSIYRIKNFIESIDLPVPMITMEIIIADVTKSDLREIGINAGIGKSPSKTAGSLGPGVDMTYSAEAVNDLLQRIRGTVNLGKVTPNFYLSLQALEEDGIIRLQSTPKLSTLNGHEALLTSGETQYYKEIQNNYYGTQNPIQSESYTWKSVDANLSIKVRPYISMDRVITLEIEFEQTEFTDRVEEHAPPGTATRSFKSIVKVCNEEMVLLGGLDRNTMDKSSRGIPFLAKIPIIKWLFGKEKRNKIERTLNVFIKPSIIE